MRTSSQAGLTVTWDRRPALGEEGSYLLSANKSLSLSVWVTRAEIKENNVYVSMSRNQHVPLLRNVQEIQRGALRDAVESVAQAQERPFHRGV